MLERAFHWVVLTDHLLNCQGGHMMDTKMAHGGVGHWDGNRYGGDPGYQDDGHSAFLELRAVGNPHLTAQHRPLDRRGGGGQHFPLSTR